MTMQPPLDSMEPVAWLVYGDWLEDNNRPRAAHKCRRIAAALEKPVRLFLVCCNTSRSVWLPGRSLIYVKERLDAMAPYRVGWLSLAFVKQGWTNSGWKNEGMDWVHLPNPSMSNRLRWAFFLIQARITEGKGKQCLEE